MLHCLSKHHQQKGIKSQTQTWWKNYWELEKQLRTVPFWLSHIRKYAVIFLSGSAYRQQSRHLLTRRRFSDMFKTLKNFITWKFHKSHWKLLQKGQDEKCVRLKWSSSPFWMRQKGFKRQRAWKRSWGFFLDIVFINDKKNKYGSSIFVSISKSIWQVSIQEING